MCLRCRRGADTQLPFECPLDFFMPTYSLDESQLPYRMAGFLEHPQARDLSRQPHRLRSLAENGCFVAHVSRPQVSMSMRRSRGAIEVAASKEEYEKQLLAAGAMGHAAVLWPGTTQAEVEAAVAPFQSLAVLEVR